MDSRVMGRFTVKIVGVSLRENNLLKLIRPLRGIGRSPDNFRGKSSARMHGIG